MEPKSKTGNWRLSPTSHSGVIPKMPIDVFPPLGKPVVTILTNAPGYAALEVEKLITLPIESSMTGAPGAAIWAALISGWV